MLSKWKIQLQDERAKAKAEGGNVEEAGLKSNRRGHHGRAGFLGSSAVFSFCYIFFILQSLQFEKLSSKVSAPCPSVGRVCHKEATLDRNIVDLVKNKLASQTIFKVSLKRAQGIIFQLAYSTQFIFLLRDSYMY